MTKKQWKLLNTILIGTSLVLAAVAYHFIYIFYKTNKSNFVNKFNSKQFLVNSDSSHNSVNRKRECPNCVRRFIDGQWVEKGKENPPLAAIIIENHIDSRPPSSLTKAKLVYEAEAEGGITRFLAVYVLDDNFHEVNKIGPIRSARPYFVDWSEELSAVFVHVGGSPDSLAKIIKDNIFDLNEFYKGDFFWREQDRKAPHNVYISGDNLIKYAQIYSFGASNFIPWSFKDNKETKDKTSSRITINYPNPEYIVTWKYNKQFNNYIRYIANRPHLDEGGQQITSNNIIIEFVDYKVVDDKLRLKMNNIGEGEAIICLDGICKEGYWQKNSSTARTHFLDKENKKEIVFNSGISWIEIVRPDYRIDINED